MKLTISILLGLFMFNACASTKKNIEEQLVKSVDVSQFAKKWYVIAHIPTFLETSAYNATEAYTLKSDGISIDVDYRHNEGSFEGPIKKIPQKAVVLEHPSHAHWEIRLWWLLRFDYLIIDLADDYRYTAVGVPNKKNLWIMSQTKTMDKADYERVLKRVASLGYDLKKLRLVPQEIKF